MTPNLLVRTVQTIEVGGIICILLETVSSLKQLYTMNMVRIFTDNSAISCRLLLLHLLKVIMKKFVIWNLHKIYTKKWNFPWRINSLVNVTKCAKAGLAKWLSVRLKTKWFWARVQLQSPANLFIFTKENFIFCEVSKN